MKQLFIFFSSLTTACIWAQQKPVIKQVNANTRTETYSSFNYFTDSIEFTIIGKNDTVLTQTFYSNGQLDEKRWRNDSLYHYDEFGFLIRKEYFNIFKPNQIIKQEFNTTGKLILQTTTEGENEHQLIWDTGGNFDYDRQTIKIPPSVSYVILRDENGKKYKSEATKTNEDTEQGNISRDSVFFPNGQLKKTAILEKKGRRVRWLDFVEFNEKGQIIAPTIPFSEQLIPFKDNYNCYYGLKNQRGDTVFVPQFDQIGEVKNEDLYTTTVGSRVQLRHNNQKQPVAMKRK